MKAEQTAKERDIQLVSAWINSYGADSMTYAKLLGKVPNIVQLMQTARQDERSRCQEAAQTAAQKAAWSDVGGSIGNVHFVFDDACPDCRSNHQTFESLKTVVRGRQEEKA